MRESVVMYSADSEKAVLGCMMAQPAEVMPQAMEALGKDDFFVPAHQVIFVALRNMFSQGKAIDVMTIHQWLTDLKLAEDVGSPGILGELLVGFATHLNFSSYVEIVQEWAQKRNVIAACQAIVADAMDAPDSVADLMERAEATLFKATRQRSPKTQIVHVKDAADRWIEHQSKVQLGEVQSRIKTGLKEFDAQNGGLMRSALHVIAARPGLGKSDLMFTILRNIARAGTPVGILELEMSEAMVLERFMADGSDIDSRRFHAPLGLWEWDRLYAAQTALSKLPLHLECAFNVDLNGMRRSVRHLVSLGCEVLMIDYLQLLRSLETKYSNREQAVAEVSRTLAGLALEHGIAIMVGSQLNRIGVEGKQGLHNLRESDAIGQDARVVIILSKKDPESQSTSPTMVFNVVKYSNDATGELVMTFDMPHHRYCDYEDAVRPLL